MTNSFFQNSQKIIHAYNHMCDPLLKRFDLPQVSFDILMFLNNNPEFSTAKEICDMRHIKKNLVSVHVERLVLAGLLRRAAVPGDRRKVALFCTEKAAPVIAAGTEMQQRFYREISRGITREQRELLGELESILASNAERLLADNE